MRGTLMIKKNLSIVLLGLKSMCTNIIIYYMYISIFFFLVSNFSMIKSNFHSKRKSPTTNKLET